MQSLIVLKEPLIDLLKNKITDDITTEMCIWILADSQAIYNCLKNAVGSLWQIFTTFDSYVANRARDVFLRYNNLIRLLKDFAERCPEEYPGQIPNYSLLSEKTIEQVNAQIIGKENLNISTNLLKFEHIERDGSPVKKTHRTTISTDFNTGTNPLRNSAPMMTPTNQSMQMMNGYPMIVAYPANMFYPQQFYYQPFPNNR